jgi:hypothetical protein
MRNVNSVRTGIAAVIGAGLLVVAPTIASALDPQDRDVCPAIDTQPVCDLVAELASDGTGGQRATVAPSPRRNADAVHFDVRCASKTIVRLVPCAR